MIENIIDELEKKYPNNNWDIELDEKSDKYIIVTDDWELYMESKSFRNFVKVLRVKYPKEKFFFVYKKINYE